MSDHVPGTVHPKLVGEVKELSRLMLNVLCDLSLARTVRADIIANMTRQQDLDADGILVSLENLWTELADPPPGAMDRLQYGWVTDVNEGLVIATSVPLFLRSGYSGLAMKLDFVFQADGMGWPRLRGFEPSALADVVGDEERWTSLDGSAPEAPVRQDILPGAWRAAPVPHDDYDPSRPVSTSARAAFEAIVHRLVERDYQGLVDEGLAIDREEGIGFWIDGYPDELIDLPPEAWDEAEMAPIVNQPGVWWVLLPLWGKRGRTDLTLEASLVDGPQPQIEVQLIHVM